MKARGLVVALCASILVFAPRLFDTSSAATQKKGADGGKTNQPYSARLISPKAGDVLVPGQQIRIEWESTLPRVDLSWCEQEVYLSLDGGKSNVARITPQLDPQTGYYNWVVPKTPSERVVLDIHFGCEGYFNETPSVQFQSEFAIANDEKAAEVTVKSVSPEKAAPGDTVRIAWDSSVQNVEYFELLISYDRGAHFNTFAKTKDVQFDWEVPNDFAGHATFQVVAHTFDGGQVESTVSADPQLLVRARLN